MLVTSSLLQHVELQSAYFDKMLFFSTEGLLCANTDMIYGVSVL